MDEVSPAKRLFARLALAVIGLGILGLIWLWNPAIGLYLGILVAGSVLLFVVLILWAWAFDE